MFDAAVRTFRSWNRSEAKSLPQEVHPDWHWTPDQWKLEQYFEQNFFIPNEMKTGGRYHNLVRDITPGALPLNPIVYTHNQFLAFEQDLGKDENGRIIKSPIFMPADYEPSGYIESTRQKQLGKIQGEVYSVCANKIYLLDKHMLNTVRYVRQRVRITYPWRYVSYGKDHPLPKISPHSFKTTVAWMYVGVPKYWDPLIGGVFAKAMPLYEHETPRPWIGEFYKFDV